MDKMEVWNKIKSSIDITAVHSLIYNSKLPRKTKDNMFNNWYTMMFEI